MGQAGSSTLLPEEVAEISAETLVSTDEVRRLYARFQSMDRRRRGKIGCDELMMIPELAMNPVAPRLARLFEDCNFREFVQLLAAFAKDAPANAKRKFIFRVYDMDDDGFISLTDLRAVLQMLLGENLDELTIDKLAEQVLKDADTDGDGRISQVEFEAAMLDEDVVRGLGALL